MVEATRLGLYRAKCLPDFKAIIARARRMRKNHPLLRSIYIMTDAPGEWAEEIRGWLASDAWDKVFVGAADVYPDWQDHEVGIAADMEIARRAGVYIGNGVSPGRDERRLTASSRRRRPTSCSCVPVTACTPTLPSSGSGIAVADSIPRE